MLKPEHLPRATELYGKWMRLRDLEYAAHVNYSTGHRVRILNIRGAGLKSTDIFDQQDLSAAGVDLSVIDAAIVEVVKVSIDQAMSRLLDELRSLGVDADQMAGDRETSMRSWKDAK